MTSSWGQSKESLRTGWKDLGSLGEVTPGGTPRKNRQTSRGIWTLGVGSWESHSLAEGPWSWMAAGHICLLQSAALRPAHSF